MLKVGRKRKRKERKNEKKLKLDCLDLSFALLRQLLASLA